MACDLTASRAKGCDNLQGGVEEFYFFNRIDDPFTLTGRLATAMNVGLTAAYKYVIQGDGNTFAESSITDKKLGTKVNTQTLVAQLIGQDTATDVELDSMGSGDIAGVYKNRNGEYRWIFEQGVNVTATIESVTGGARVDFNGYNVTLVAETLEKSPVLDAATVTAFLAIVV